MLPDARAHRRILAKVLLVVSAALLMLLHLYNPPVAGLWTRTFFNSMHVPVFGIVALSLCVTINSRTNWGLQKRMVVVLLSVLVLSLLSEAAQISGPRDASVEDLVSDWLGAIAALLVFHAFETGDMRSRSSRIASALAGITVLLVALSSSIVISAAYLERTYQQPVLVSFDARFGHYFRRMQHATLNIIDDSTNTRKIGQITLDEGAWPGIIFSDLWPDWRSYSTLVIELGLEGGKSLDVQLRVHDQEHKRGDQPYDDRFNKTIVLQPGRHTLRIPLEEIRDAPKQRQMDLSQVDGMAVFCSARDEGREFLLAGVWLE